MSQRRTFRALALALTVAIVLTGCRVSFGGQKAATAELQLESIEGVETGVVDAGTVWAGFNREDRSGASAELSDGADPTPEFFNYLVALAWSVNDHKPNRPLTIFIRSNPQVDVRGLAEQAGWTVPELAFIEVGGSIGLGQVEARLGPWPGKPPKAPTGALILPDTVK